MSNPFQRSLKAYEKLLDAKRRLTAEQERMIGWTVTWPHGDYLRTGVVTGACFLSNRLYVLAPSGKGHAIHISYVKSATPPQEDAKS